MGPKLTYRWCVNIGDEMMPSGRSRVLERCIVGDCVAVCVFQVCNVLHQQAPLGLHAPLVLQGLDQLRGQIWNDVMEKINILELVFTYAIYFSDK